MHKDVRLPAPTARSELNTWMRKESVKSTDYILDDKGKTKLKRLGKSCASQKPGPTSFFQSFISSGQQHIIFSWPGLRDKAQGPGPLDAILMLSKNFLLR